MMFSSTSIILICKTHLTIKRGPLRRVHLETKGGDAKFPGGDSRGAEETLRFSDIKTSVRSLSMATRKDLRNWASWKGERGNGRGQWGRYRCGDTSTSVFSPVLYDTDRRYCFIPKASNSKIAWLHARWRIAFLSGSRVKTAPRCALMLCHFIFDSHSLWRGRKGFFIYCLLKLPLQRKHMSWICVWRFHEVDALLHRRCDRKTDFTCWALASSSHKMATSPRLFVACSHVRHLGAR